MDYNVYNYFIGNYAQKPATKYDTHKSSELRSVMKNITKMTQSSPIYLVRLSQAKQEYALNIKEAAISLSNTLSMLSEDSMDSVFAQKKAVSSDEAQVGTRIINEDYSQLPERADDPGQSSCNHAGQCRQRILSMTGKGLSAGTYRFRVAVGDDSYDFQYNIRKDANHREIIGRPL